MARKTDFNIENHHIVHIRDNASQMGSHVSDRVTITMMDDVLFVLSRLIFNPKKRMMARWQVNHDAVESMKHDECRCGVKEESLE